MEEPKEERLLVIVATYNEIDNLPRLILQLQEHVAEADVLVIDDASPDGTGNWCETARQRHSHLHVIHREGKLGLGSATLAGFLWGLERDYSMIATMDADLSHDPKSLADMVSRLGESPDVDVILGSRYITGGGTEGWPLRRRIASRMVNWFARLVLRLRTYDNSGAFRVYRRSALERVELGRLKSNNYAYLEEILWRMRKCGLVVREFPITFRNREAGKSKTSAILGLSVVWQILKMGLGVWR